MNTPPDISYAPKEQWTFLTNHAHVLVCLSQMPEYTVREVALKVGITERAVQRIIGELENAGFLSRERIGRRTRYSIHVERPLRHRLEAHCSVGDLLNLL